MLCSYSAIVFHELTFFLCTTIIVWATIEPELLAILKEEKASRLQFDAITAFNSRRRALKVEYLRLLREKPPLSHALYPLPHELQGLFPNFLSFGYTPATPHENYAAEARDVILQAMPTLVENWVIERKNRILSTLVSSTTVPLTPCGTFDIPFELTLAKNVYTTTKKSHTVLHGAEIFAFRIDGPNVEASLHAPSAAVNIPTLHTEAQRIVLSLLESGGLDEATMTTQELDHSHSIGFACVTCSINARRFQSHGGTIEQLTRTEQSSSRLNRHIQQEAERYTRRRLTWREAVCLVYCLSWDPC